ncbi:MAG: SDR family oxidoreductase [Candidatus Eremiobacteraeota bacterium]|nr:SDR family oxidoreductase [Candidatus Eremiobacteraeota bacterium]
MDQRLAVLVTGASTGIGAVTAESLARTGFLTFAGVRTEVDAARIDRSAGVHPNLRAIRLDVSDAGSIRRAAGEIAESGLPLHGLVNNAGIAVAGPVEFVPLEEWRRQFEVNLFGAIAVTQALLPLVRAARGRVVFVGSISGRFSVPYLAPYCASKFALRAVADALRLETFPMQVRVSLVEPGSVRTPIWAKGRARKDEMLARIPADAPEVYRRALEVVVRQSEREEALGFAPERVAAAILHALTARRPRARYLLGGRARARAILSLFPSALADRIVLNALRQ